MLIVASSAAVEPTTEKPDVARNQLRQTRGTSHDADSKTKKPVIRKEAAKLEAAKPEAAKPEAAEPEAAKGL